MITDQVNAFGRFCWVRARFADITHLARDFAATTLCGRPTYGSPLREVGGGRHVCPRCAAVAIEIDQARQELETIRAALRAEDISYGELARLQDLTPYIKPGDVELLEAAGVPEFGD